MEIVLWLFGMVVLYLVIYAAVKDGIDRSEVGKIIIKRYGKKKKKDEVSDEEIEKEFDDRF